MFKSLILSVLCLCLGFLMTSYGVVPTQAADVSGEARITTTAKKDLIKERKLTEKERLTKLLATQNAQLAVLSVKIQTATEKLQVIRVSDPAVYRSLLKELNILKSDKVKLLAKIKTTTTSLRVIESWLKKNP